MGTNPLNKNTASNAAFLAALPQGFMYPSLTNTPNTIYGLPSTGWCQDNYCFGGSPSYTLASTPSTKIGRYQPQYASWNCVTCPAGFNCQNNAQTTPVACQAGNYCPRGTYTTGTQCPIGTFSMLLYSQTIATCQNCIAGYYCSTLGKSSITVADKCTAGFFCLTKSTVPNPTCDPETYPTCGLDAS